MEKNPQKMSTFSFVTSVTTLANLQKMECISLVNLSGFLFGAFPVIPQQPVLLYALNRTTPTLVVANAPPKVVGYKTL